MRYQRVHIQALEVLTPPLVMTTAEIEGRLAPLYKRIGIPSGVIQSLTGVQARRFWADGQLPSEAAAEVARRTLDKHGVPRSGLEALVSTSVSKDFLEPPVASMVSGAVGVSSRCMNFDVSHACLGFMTGMLTVANLIELGQIECGMVVAGEGSRTVTQATIDRLLAPGVDFKTFGENLPTLTLGSMAVAALLVHERHSRGGHQLLGGAALSATQHSQLCIGTATEMRTDATTLLREGVNIAAETFVSAKAELGVETKDVKEFCLHQVGQANHDGVTQRLGIPPDRAQRLYREYGNTGAAGVPSTLAKAVELGRVQAGDVVMMLGIGSGLNCTMLGVRW